MGDPAAGDRRKAYLLAASDGSPKPSGSSLASGVAMAVAQAKLKLGFAGSMITLGDGRWALALLDAARVFAGLGNTADAKTAYESAIPILERELGPDAPRVVEARKRYAESSLSKNER